jgi:hypothetical protein
MPFKPNYRQQRSARSRAKEERAQEKLQKRQDNAARRKAERDPPPETEEPQSG